MMRLSMSPPRITRAIDIVAVLMAISVALALAGLTWRLFGAADGEHAIVAPAAAPRPPADVSSLVQLAPFGTPGAAGGAITGPTSLPLALKAIFLARPLASTTVIISANGQPPETYTVGQSAGGLATIDSIGRDHVVLNVNGQLQQLFFPARMKTLLAQNQAQGQPAPAAAPPPANPAAAPPPANATPPLSVAPNSLPPPATPPPPAVPPAQGPQGAFLDSLGATRTSRGYQIGGTPAPQLAQAGLAAGDIIQSVNGVALGGGGQDGAVLQAAFASGRAQVQVLRGGRQINLSLASR